MYLPPQFNEKDRRIAVELMRTHSFASLITTDEEGLPAVSHLPMVLKKLLIVSVHVTEVVVEPGFIKFQYSGETFYLNTIWPLVGKE